MKDGLIDAFNNYHMGVTAENVAEKWNITRDEQDNFALNSQSKVQDAIKKKHQFMKMRLLKMKIINLLKMNILERI